MTSPLKNSTYPVRYRDSTSCPISSSQPNDKYEPGNRKMIDLTRGKLIQNKRYTECSVQKTIPFV